MQHMQRQCFCLTWMALGLILFALPALQAETRYPFERMGVIDNIYPGENRLVINDISYRLLPLTPVYYYKGKVDNDDPKRSERPNRHALRRGMHIGFTAVKDSAKGQHRLVEVWILPVGSIRTGGERG